ncbi:hypothetical protein J2S43_004662 [Catenuloplanes nepalensis]|uniref:Uncharacterized protein n=1 Tax=Catenuloplanes nepalensis TaxID=587533 RepID=A0ABT9MXI9_9ACTN|nr:hypothetical protein [Catenuloplanes nepalensis]MDP9796150.1 hypothetical protein [Catenuloplanes nepalensis]
MRALMYQFYRGIPDEAMDRLVERPLFGAGNENVRMTLDDLGDRADMMGLPVEIPISRFAAPDGAHPFLTNRVVFSDASGPTTRENALLVKVEPKDRVWAENPFATVGDDVRAEAIAGGYPSGRIVPVPGGKRLGRPGPLAEFAHAAALTGGRPLTPEDLTRDGVPPLTTLSGYGEVLAHVAGAPEAKYSLVEVRGQGEADAKVFVAVHDPAGGSYLEFGSGTSAVFPDLPESIRITTLPPDFDLAGLTDDPATAGAVPATPLAFPAGVTPHHTFGPAGTRSVDWIGGSGGAPRELLETLSTHAEALNRSVIVIGPQPRDARSLLEPRRSEKRDLLRTELMVLQHIANENVAPIVVDYGGAGAEFAKMAARHGAPVMRQSMGGGLDLDRSWTGVGPDGSTVAPFAQITKDRLKSVGDLQQTRVTRVDPVLMSLLTTPLNDAAALRERFETDGSTLKALRPQIQDLPVDPELFRAHDKLIELFERNDGLFGPATKYLADIQGGDNRMVLPDLPTVIREAPPAVRTAALEDLKAVTFGTHDGGAARAVLDAVKTGISGGSREAMAKTIRDYAVYLPKGEGGRADVIRTLQGWRDAEPEGVLKSVFDEAAVLVATCP